MNLNSHGKINLGLDIISKRADGYHDIATIMQSIELHDFMSFEKAKSGIEITCNREELSLGSDNYIYKAWELMCKIANSDLGIKVHLEKKLPLAAGLAGGTSNGSTTMHALNKLYGLKISKELMTREALSLGADFPFCIRGGSAMASGIGEVLTSITIPELDVIIVNPGFQVSTKEVYSKIKIDDERVDFAQIIEILKMGKVEDLKGKLINKMEPVVGNIHNEIFEIKEDMYKLGAVESCMSGSGPTVFGIFKKEKLDFAYDMLLDKYKYVKKTRTIRGINI